MYEAEDYRHKQSPDTEFYITTQSNGGSRVMDHHSDRFVFRKINLALYKKHRTMLVFAGGEDNVKQ